jgi:hypothetical protein
MQSTFLPERLSIPAIIHFYLLLEISVGMKTVSGKLPGLKRRLAKVEKVFTETAEREKLASCICKVGDRSAPTVVFSWEPEKFEAEMNQTCPVHGFRNLGQLTIIYLVDRGGARCDRSRFDELLGGIP